MKFRNNIINQIDNKIWNAQKIFIRKSNNLIDYNSNKSRQSSEDDIRDNIATKMGKVLNTNVSNLFGSQTTYRKRIEQYEYMANFSEIDEVLDIISDEICSYGFDTKIIQQTFSPIGEKNIDSETKTAINDIFSDIIVKNYNMKKNFKNDVKNA